MTVPSTIPDLTPPEQAALTEFVKNIRNQFPDRILAVMLFGSKARGDADTESDLDLFVLVDKENDALRTELWCIASDVSLKHNVVISARVFGQARWDEMRRMRLPLYRSIVTDGIPLLSENIPTR